MPFLPFPEQGPVPVNAMWESGTAEIAVLFDQPLMDGPLEASNWSYQPPELPTIVAAEVIEGNVLLTLNGPPAQVNSVSYSPPPFDVVGADGGEPAEGFSDFPVT
jgi:hypothetical protein